MEFIGAAICMRESECVLHPARCKNPLHTLWRGGRPPHTACRHSAWPIIKKAGAFFTLLLLQPLKWSKLSLNFMSGGAPVRYENKSACELADMDFTPVLAPRFGKFMFYCH
jgi:hypothetical protein